MTGPNVTPAPSMPAWRVRLDAASRAGRTFVQGFVLDVLAAAGMAVTSALADSHFAWSWQFWAVQAGLFGKTVLQTLAAYLMRLKVPPKA